MAQTTKKICNIHGDNAVNVRMMQRWFRNEDFNLSDEKRSGRFIEVDNDQILALIQTDQCYDQC